MTATFNAEEPTALDPEEGIGGSVKNLKPVFRGTAALYIGSRY